MKDFKGKKIAVLGLGMEGLSTLDFFKKQGAKVTGLDRKESEKYLENFGQYDVIVRSPGVNPDVITQALLSRGARSGSAGKKKRAEITSQTKIFFELCPCPIIGVTGTKGKGTTSALIYEMLKRDGKDVYLGGNIGNPPLGFLNKLNTQPASRQGGSIVILELSSFQLLDLNKSPHVAVMLMTTSEHLDYHKDTYEYVNAKRNILRFQTSSDFAIINKDYLPSRESDVETKGKVFYISREQEIEQGCFVKDEKIILRRVGKEDEIVVKTKDILLPGRHNLENVCAAIMAATIMGVSKKNIASVLKSFKGLEHRLELVDTVAGVRYYDDSFSTTPETAIAAIEAFKDPEILILGGSSKNSDFTELGRVISEAKNIKAIIGIGKEWERIKAQFIIHNSEFRIIEGLRDMRSIVQKACEIAEPDDVVILTPACASFDMFKNYKDRGEQFKKEVKKLNKRI